MAVLNTVADYVAAARRLLQDEIPEYRYPDLDLLEAFNFALSEAYTLRFDLFIGLGATSARQPAFTPALPSYAVIDTTPVKFPEEYRPALVYFMVGHVQLRDDENDQDTRAVGFLGMFRKRLGAS